MRTVVAQRGSDRPVVVDLPASASPAGGVRIAVAAAGFTYFDAFVAAHQDDFGLPDQVGLGFDFSGTVREIGSGVTDIGVGDRVAGLHVDISAPVRAHAEEIVVDAGSLAVLPDGLDLQTAGAAPLSALTGRQALDLLGPERGSLLVTGAAGSIGGWLTELATRDGWQVTALVRPGTEHLVTRSKVVTDLEQLEQHSFDAVLDAAALYATASAAVRDGGRYVGFKPGQPLPPERGIVVSTVGVVPDGAALATLLPLAANGTVPVRIAGRAALADAADAYRRAETDSGSRGRWLLLP